MSKKLLVFLGIAVVILVLAYGLGGPMLKARMESDLSRACRRPVTVRAAQVAAPLGIRLIGVEVAPLRGEPAAPLTIGRLEVQVVLGSALQGRPTLALELVQPEFSISWNRRIREVLRMGGIPGGIQTPAPVTSVRVRNGKLRLLDEEAVPPVRWHFKDVDASVHARSGPHYEFQLSAGLEAEEGSALGQVQSTGSVIAGGPLEAKVSLRHENLGLLAPYLRKALGTAPDRGLLQMESQYTLVEGVLVSRHEATASGVAFSTDQPTTLGLEGNRLVELLADREGKVYLSFMVNGRWGEEKDWSDLAAGAMRQALQQAMARGIQRVLDATQQQPLEERLRRQMESIGR